MKIAFEIASDSPVEQSALLLGLAESCARQGHQTAVIGEPACDLELQSITFLPARNIESWTERVAPGPAGFINSGRFVVRSSAGVEATIPPVVPAALIRARRLHRDSVRIGVANSGERGSRLTTRVVEELRRRRFLFRTAGTGSDSAIALDELHEELSLAELGNFLASLAVVFDPLDANEQLAPSSLCALACGVPVVVPPTVGYDISAVAPGVHQANERSPDRVVELIISAALEPVAIDPKQQFERAYASLASVVRLES